MTPGPKFSTTTSERASRAENTTFGPRPGTQPSTLRSPAPAGIGAARRQGAAAAYDFPSDRSLAATQDRLTTLYAHQGRRAEAGTALTEQGGLWPKDGLGRYDLARRIAAFTQEYEALIRAFADQPDALKQAEPLAMTFAQLLEDWHTLYGPR